MRDLSALWCGDGREAAARLQREQPGETDRLIRRANEICRNSFIFQEHWDMERTHVPVAFSDPIDWHYQPGDDPEWTYAFNRHTFFLILAKAYALSGDETYVRHGVRLISDWIQRVPLTDETRLTAWRAIETGLRSVNWLKSLSLIQNSTNLTDAFKTLVSASLRVHAQELVSAHGPFQRLSNWGVLQDHGLFLLGFCFDEEMYTNLAVQRLTDNLHLQVLDDGVQWEQSPLYHCEVLHCCLDVVQAANRSGVPLPGPFTQKTHAMAKALAVWCKPDGCIPCQSDSDDVDARDLLVQAAALFNDGFLKSVSGDALCPESIWNMGVQACDAYQKIPAASPCAQSAALAHSGNYILRSGGNYLHMHCGSLGSGHGHADLLHIDLYAHGEDILIDGGRYTYVDTPARRTLRSARAHNTVIVDDAEFTVCSGPWAYDPIAEPVKGEYVFTEHVDYISGAHLGYWKKGVFTRRKIVHIKPDIYLLFDEFYAKDKHNYKQFFHFHNQGAISLDNATALYTGANARAAMVLLSDTAGRVKLERSPRSRVYNSMEYGECLVAEYEAEGFACFMTAISTAPTRHEPDFAAKLLPVSLLRSGIPLSGEQAHAVQLIRNGAAYVVILCHTEIISEVDLISAGGQAGYGKVLVFTPEHPDGLRLV